MSRNTALLIIDMLNDFAFEGAERLLPAAEAAGEAIDALRRQARARGVPIIYVNDNRAHWRADRQELIARFTARDGPGGALSRRLRPEADDLFVIKPRFSGFYATSLPVLLPDLKVTRLILTGIAADICVLFTAADAHMRQYELWIPANAVASEEEPRTHRALEIMRNAMSAETRPTNQMTLEDWLGAARRPEADD